MLDVCSLQYYNILIHGHEDRELGVGPHLNSDNLASFNHCTKRRSAADIIS